jgi:hypothetical protein
MSQIRSITVTTIPHNDQRYDTIGDWVFDEREGHVTVLVSELEDWRMGFACAIHELIETALCIRAGVDESVVSRFDILYEARRQCALVGNPTEEQKEQDTLLARVFDCLCTPTEDSEPGEDKHAPYRAQHAFADGIERLLAYALDLSWSDYSDKVANTPWRGRRMTYEQAHAERWWLEVLMAQFAFRTPNYHETPEGRLASAISARLARAIYNEAHADR